MSNTNDHSSPFLIFREPKDIVLHKPNVKLIIGIVAGIGALFILIAILAYLIWRRINPSANAAPPPPPPQPEAQLAEFRRLHQQSVFVFEQGRDDQEHCPICLEAYQAGDELRRLVTCGHMFHLLCIDDWVGSSAAAGGCPNCRSSLL